MSSPHMSHAAMALAAREQIIIDLKVDGEEEAVMFPQFEKVDIDRPAWAAQMNQRREEMLTVEPGEATDDAVEVPGESANVAAAPALATATATATATAAAAATASGALSPSVAAARPQAESEAAASQASKTSDDNKGSAPGGCSVDGGDCIAGEEDPGAALDMAVASRMPLQRAQGWHAADQADAMETVQETPPQPWKR